MNPSSSPDIGKEKEVFSSAVSNPVGCEGNGFKFQVRHAVLTALVLWVFGCNITWVALDKVPPAYDYARHLYIAFLYWQALDWGSPSLWLDLLSVEPFYPPLYHLSLIPFAVVLGFSAYSAVLANSLYLAVIILSTYGIGSSINDRRTGLMAAFFVSCYPWLSYVSRTPMIDTMLTAAVALAYYLFLKSKNFEDRFYSLMFAVAFAGGLMVKWTFLFFLLPAVILGLIGDKPIDLKRSLIQFLYYLGLIFVLLVIPFFIFILEEWRWVPLLLEMSLVGLLVRATPLVGISPAKVINLITLTVVSLVICFPWYSHTSLNLVQGVLKHSGHGLKEGDPTAGVDFWMNYVWALQSSVGGILFLSFLIGIIFFLVRKKYFNPLLIGWIVLPYIVFTLMINKDMRYIMPVLPCIAVISSFWIFRIQRAVFRRALICLTVVMGLFTHLYSGFFQRGVDFKVLGASAFGAGVAPNDQYWPLERVLNDIIVEAAPGEGEAVTVRTLTNYPHFQRGGFRNMAAFNDLPIVMKSVKRNVGELTDFFITKKGKVGPGFSERDIGPKKKKLLEDPSLQRTFPLFKKYSLPDGTYGLVFRRDVSPANDIKDVDDLNEVGKRFLEALSEYPIYGIKGGDNITVFVEPTENPSDLFLGRYKSIRVKADSTVTNSIQLHDFELIFEGAQINLYDLFLNGKLIFLELDRIYPRGTIRFEELEELAAKAMKGQGEARLEGQEGRLVLRVNYRLSQGFDVKGKAIIRVEFEPGRSIKPTLELLDLGPVSVPQVFYRRMANIQIHLTPTLGWPLYTDIHSIRIYPRHLEINQLRN
ncbi:MAG: hypothetical protein CL877_09160 [Dehalococcoidales bacterium]|nr:hypothetical protein [Dehalococcoidales bacterium]